MWNTSTNTLLASPSAMTAFGLSISNFLWLEKTTMSYSITQDSLAQAVKADKEARDLLQTSIEHHRVAQDVAQRRMSDAQQLQNDM